MAAPGSEHSAAPQTFGHYTLLEELGRGGQGTVWLAEDHKLKRKVALKVLGTAPGALSPDRLQRFQREAEAAARLDDPHICGLLDAGDVDGVPYLAFRYLEGETLAQRIARAYEQKGDAATPGSDQATSDPSSREGVQWLLRTFEKLARALHKAHEGGLIHRDVKPGNVMILPDGEPVLLDFGLARDELADDHSLTHSGDLLGTPAYMSPEQLTAQRIPLDRRTDVYSLGATLYEALTLQKPFVGLTRAELYQKILSTDPSSATSHNRQIPRELQIVVETAMEKDRNRRYQTAADFAEDLERVRTFEPIRARPIGRLLRTKRWAQRHPALATGVVLLTLGLTTSLAMLVQLDAALRSSEQNKRAAQDTLAGAFLEKADRAIADGDHSAAAVFAAAALLNDPNNPHGPHYRPVEDPGPEAQERMALMHSRHFEAIGGRRLTYWRTLRPPDGLRSNGEFALAPVDDLLAVGTKEGTVCVWEFEGNRQPVQLHGGRTGASGVFGNLASGSSLRFAPDGKVLAQIVEGAVQLWDVAAKRFAGEITVEDQPASIAFLSADDLVIGDSGGWVRVWQLSTSSFRAQRRFPSYILAVDSSPPRGLVAIASLNEKVWLVDADLRGGRALETPKHALDFAFNPDGRYLVAAVADNALWTFRLDGVGEGSRRPTPYRPESVHFSPDGKLLAHGGEFGPGFLLDAESGAILDLLRGARMSTQYLRIAPDGRTLAASGFGSDVRLWHIEQPKLRDQRAEHRAPFSGVAVSSDGLTIVTASHNDGMLLLWTLAPGADLDRAQVRTLRAPEVAGGKPYGVAISPDHSLMVSCTLTGEVELRDLRTGAVKQLRPPDTEPTYGGWRVCFDPDGRVLYVPEPGGRIRCWDVQEGRDLAPLQAGEAHVLVVTLSRDGELMASGSEDGTVRLWRRVHGEAPLILQGHVGLVSGLAFSPDGSELASSGEDARIRLWDTQTGSRLHELAGHEAWVNSVHYSPDGRFLLSASDDNTVRLWGLASHRLLQVFRCAEQATDVVFAPDSRHFFMNDGRYLTRYRVTVDERIDDPRELLDRAERAAGVRLEGLELVGQR